MHSTFKRLFTIKGLVWILIFVAACLTARQCFLWLDSLTYVWQHTTLTPLLHQIHRKECKLSTKYLSRASYDLTMNASSYLGNNLRIGLLSFFHNYHEDPNWSPSLIEAILRNRQHYCDIHNYVCIEPSDGMIDKSRPAAWSKLLALSHHLPRFDYLLYIDMDLVIMNPHTPLTTLISLSPQSSFLLTEDRLGINTGAMIVKNTPFAAWFLSTAWNQTQLVLDKRLPFRYEQRAFHFLLESSLWRGTKGIPQYRGVSSQLRAHFAILPQCSLNSYLLPPLLLSLSSRDREQAQYVSGDWAIHLAGRRPSSKPALLRYCLNLAEKT